MTFSGRVKAPCSNEQRGMIVCAGVVIASHVVCPDFIVSGALLDGFAPYAFVCGLFGMTLPVLLFGLGTPHLTPGMLDHHDVGRAAQRVCSSPCLCSGSRFPLLNGLA